MSNRLTIMIMLILGLAMAGGCTIRLSGPANLIEVVEPVDWAETVSRQPVFRWKLLDPAIRSIGGLQCRLYEETPERRRSVWLVVNLQEHDTMTFPTGPTGELGFGASDGESQLKPNTQYVAIFSYTVGPENNFDPVVVRFTTAGEKSNGE